MAKQVTEKGMQKIQTLIMRIEGRGDLSRGDGASRAARQ